MGQSKKPKKIAKSTVIKALQKEYLIPNTWEHGIDKEGNELRGNKAKKFCAVCAVGSIITTAKRAGKVGNFSYNIACGDMDASPHINYFRKLIEGKLYLTALSDKFEGLCDKKGIDGYEWECALKKVNETSKEIAVLEKRKNLDHEDRLLLDSCKTELKDNLKTVRYYEKKMKSVRKIMINFVEKEFPHYIEIKPESEYAKERALEGSGYMVSGHKINKNGEYGWF